MSATEAEALALHNAVMHWSPYLLIQEFEIYTDHSPLTYMFGAHNKSGNKKVSNWIHDLQHFRFSIHYKCGRLNIDADAMSRLFRFQDIRDLAGKAENTFGRVDEELLRTIRRKQAMDEDFQRYSYPPWENKVGVLAEAIKSKKKKGETLKTVEYMATQGDPAEEDIVLCQFTHVEDDEDSDDVAFFAENSD